MGYKPLSHLWNQSEMISEAPSSPRVVGLCPCSVKVLLKGIWHSFSEKNTFEFKVNSCLRRNEWGRVKRNMSFPTLGVCFCLLARRFLLWNSQFSNATCKESSVRDNYLGKPVKKSGRRAKENLPNQQTFLKSHKYLRCIKLGKKCRKHLCFIHWYNTEWYLQRIYSP